MGFASRCKEEVYATATLGGVANAPWAQAVPIVAVHRGAQLSLTVMAPGQFGGDLADQ